MDERTRKVAIASFLVVLFLVTAGLLVHNAFQVVSANPEVGRVLGTGLRVKTAPVTSRTYPDLFGAVGDANPAVSLPLRKASSVENDLARRVQEVLVEAGDFVKRGDLLIRFDTSALDSRILAREDEKDIAVRNLEELGRRQGHRRSELLAAIRTAEAQVQSGRSSVSRAEENLQRMKELWNEGIISKFRLETAYALRDEALFSLRSAEELLLQRRHDLDDLEVRLATQRDAVTAELSGVEADLMASKGDLENAFLTAPWDGMVTDVSVKPGEWILRGDGLVRLAQIDTIHVPARVAQEKVDRVFVGLQAEVVFDALPYQTFHGQVVNIDPTIDKGSATFKATVSLANPEYKIRPGMSGFVRFRNQRVAMVIPQPAITGSGGDTAVFVAENDVAKLRQVQVGEVVDVGFVEVLGGVSTGEEVVIHGLKDLQDGDPIRIVQE